VAGPLDFSGSKLVFLSLTRLNFIQKLFVEAELKTLLLVSGG
jgi:hypothetical protein